MRDHAVAMMRGGDAHLTFDDVVRDFPPELRGVRPRGTPHSAWQILEHLRICQWDILEFSRDPAHVSPEFPAGYWPASPKPPDADAWDRAVAGFRSDARAMDRLVARSTRSLVERVEHPDAQAKHTLLRETMVLARHNSYHLGELVLLRRLLGAWPADS